MNEQRWTLLLTGLVFFIGGVASLITDGFSLTSGFFAVMGFGGFLIGGWPIWTKILRRKE